MGVAAEYGPICEAMYLMMSADGKITNDEREVLKGALRNLSGDTVRSVHIEAMLEQAAENVAEQGRDARLKDVIAHLHEDPPAPRWRSCSPRPSRSPTTRSPTRRTRRSTCSPRGSASTKSRANELLDSVEADLAERPAQSKQPAT